MNIDIKVDKQCPKIKNVPENVLFTLKSSGYGNRYVKLGNRLFYISDSTIQLSRSYTATSEQEISEIIGEITNIDITVKAFTPC